MMVCLIFHTAIIINSKNWRITVKLYFENLSIFFRKANLHTCSPSPCSFLFAFQWSPSPSQWTYFLNDPKLFAKNFSYNSNLGISLPFYLSRTNLKLHNISKTPWMVKGVITNLHSSKACGPDCIPVVVLKNCEPGISYIQAELFNTCLKESCLPDCWMVSLVVSVFKNVEERSTAKIYSPVSLLSVISKVFEKLVNNRIVIT